MKLLISLCLAFCAGLTTCTSEGIASASEALTIQVGRKFAGGCVDELKRLLTGE